jgi:glycosyltransferase involved in cell wall biosynthesis
VTNSVPPKVSVCIPIYNGSTYIAEAIESVLSQTYNDFRLIVCDNCSTDNTEEIVRSFRDPRLTYVRNSKNLGLVGNSNRCLDLSDGEYVCILHHDDVMMPNNIECKVRLLDEHPEVGFVHSNIILIDPQGEVIAWNIWNEDSRRDYIEVGLTGFHRFLAYLPFGSNIFIGAVLARRACYERLGGFNPELPHCSDNEMWMRMLLFYDVACIGTPLVKYRVHPTSASSNWGDYTSINYLKEHYLAATMIFSKYKDYIPQSDSLKQQISLAFAEQALKWACKNFNDGDFAAGRNFMKEAKKMCPQIRKNPLFWKAAARLGAGPKGVRFYEVVRKHFIGHAR